MSNNGNNRLGSRSSNFSARNSHGGSSSSGASRSSSKRSGQSARHTSGSSSGKSSGKKKQRNRRREVDDDDDDDDDENVDPRQGVRDVVEETTRNAYAKSIPEAADAMLRAIDENEWCSDLRGAVMLRLASESGFMLASRADIDKGKTERESRKVSYKSSAFHLILPFMAYFKDLRLTEIKCDEHSLLTMVGHMWGAYDEERGISCAEMDKEVPVFLPPMKCTTYRVAREAMHTNLVSALQVVTNRYTDGNGNARKEITSDYILETMQAEIDKQSELAMRGLGRAMFSKGLPPARHSRPAGPGEIMENMTYMDVYGCQPTAPYHLPFADTREKSPLALKT